MSIHFKFKSAKDFDTITFAGTSIRVIDLKKSIVEKKKLNKGLDFDLVITDAQSGKVYDDENTQLPRNTSVTVKRIPSLQPGSGLLARMKAEAAAAAAAAPTLVPVLSLSGSSSAVPQGTDATGTDPGGAQTIDDELAALQSIQEQAEDMRGARLGNKTWTASSGSNADKVANYYSSAPRGPPGGGRGYPHPGGRGAMGAGRGGGGDPFGCMGGRGRGAPGGPGMMPPGSMVGNPPSNYVCYRCGTPGHYIQNCPTNGDPDYDQHRVKKKTGIPKSFMKAVSDPSEIPVGAGKTVVNAPWGGLAIIEPQNKNFSKLMAKSGGSATLDHFILNPPEHLACHICKRLMNDAVLIPCCQESACDECLRGALIERTLSCPLCKAPNMSPEGLLPNKVLRTSVDEFLRRARTEQQEREQLVKEAEEKALAKQKSSEMQASAARRSGESADATLEIKKGAGKKEEENEDDEFGGDIFSAEETEEAPAPPAKAQATASSAKSPPLPPSQSGEAPPLPPLPPTSPERQRKVSDASSAAGSAVVKPVEDESSPKKEVDQVQPQEGQPPPHFQGPPHGHPMHPAWGHPGPHGHHGPPMGFHPETWFDGPRPPGPWFDGPPPPWFDGPFPGPGGPRGHLGSRGPPGPGRGMPPPGYFGPPPGHPDYFGPPPGHPDYYGPPPGWFDGPRPPFGGPGGPGGWHEGRQPLHGDEWSDDGRRPRSDSKANEKDGDDKSDAGGSRRTERSRSRNTDRKRSRSVTRSASRSRSRHGARRSNKSSSSASRARSHSRSRRRSSERPSSSASRSRRSRSSSKDRKHSSSRASSPQKADKPAEPEKKRQKLKGSVKEVKYDEIAAPAIDLEFLTGDDSSEEEQQVEIPKFLAEQETGSSSSRSQTPRSTNTDGDFARKALSNWKDEESSKNKKNSSSRRGRSRSRSRSSHRRSSSHRRRSEEERKDKDSKVRNRRRSDCEDDKDSSDHRRKEKRQRSSDRSTGNKDSRRMVVDSSSTKSSSSNKKSSRGNNNDKKRNRSCSPGRERDRGRERGRGRDRDRERNDRHGRHNRHDRHDKKRSVLDRLGPKV